MSCRIAVLSLVVLLAGCEGEGPDPAVAARGAAREQLAAGEASAALSTVRRALAAGSEDPELRLVAAEACLALERWSEVLDHVVPALDGGVTGDLAADLRWAEGKACLNRYEGVRDETDWRRANSSLEVASGAGDHRVEAAAMLVIMHHTHEDGDPARKRRFAELVTTLAPDSQEAKTVSALLGADG
jgi:thioredoxin-like negative regulator of GroEL